MKIPAIPEHCWQKPSIQVNQTLQGHVHRDFCPNTFVLLKCQWWFFTFSKMTKAIRIILSIKNEHWELSWDWITLELVRDPFVTVS